MLGTGSIGILLCACANSPSAPRYYWGSYEDQIYVTSSQHGVLTPELQAKALQRDREAAMARHEKLPPGWHVQLAQVYEQMGRPDLASEELQAEKLAFPESSVFVDRLLTNSRQPPARAHAGEEAQ